MVFNFSISKKWLMAISAVILVGHFFLTLGSLGIGVLAVSSAFDNDIHPTAINTANIMLLLYTILSFPILFFIDFFIVPNIQYFPDPILPGGLNIIIYFSFVGFNSFLWATSFYFLSSQFFSIKK